MGKHIDKLDADAAFAFSRRFGILFSGCLILDTILRLLILPAFS